MSLFTNVQVIRHVSLLQFRIFFPRNVHNWYMPIDLQMLLKMRLDDLGNSKYPRHPSDMSCTGYRAALAGETVVVLVVPTVSLFAVAVVLTLAVELAVEPAVEPAVELADELADELAVAECQQQ